MCGKAGSFCMFVENNIFESSSFVPVPFMFSSLEYLCLSYNSYPLQYTNGVELIHEEVNIGANINVYNY